MDNLGWVSIKCALFYRYWSCPVPDCTFEASVTVDTYANYLYQRYKHIAARHPAAVELDTFWRTP